MSVNSLILAKNFQAKHTIGEVLRWFDETGFEFVYGIPNPHLLEGFSGNDSLFKLHNRGNLFTRFLVQLILIFTGSREGGFFILIGKKVRK